MKTVELIRKKRDGLELTAEEIHYLIDGYTRGEIPDYQMSAWAMAVYFRGMSPRETADLTLAMARSGEMVDLSSIEGIKVDKHSTGGVADTTTLVLAPLVAAAGLKVAKMSGRGLGHTGGTVDKLESIPGFAAELSRERFVEQVNRIGIAVISQSAEIAPADKKLYALRDVTATVNSIPLIASSVMSKKIAAGADVIVLDVKTGSGAFMKSLDESIQLARVMVEIGTNLGRETVAVVSNMDEPLGSAIGNALEVKEAIATLRGKGSLRLRAVCLELGGHMLLLAGKAGSLKEAKERLEELLDSGAALKKFAEWIAAQGGDASVCEKPELLPQAAEIVPVRAEKAGFVSAIHAEKMGQSAMMLGAGRKTKDDRIDPAVGIILRKRVGDEVKPGDVLAELHTAAGSRNATDEAVRQVSEAYRILPHPPQPQPLIYAVVTREGIKTLESSLE